MARSPKFPTLSIIIPTLNEASHLPLLLADLKAWPYELDINVVDGGSTDLTVSIAKIQGLDVINSKQSNRGYQLKIGAYKAKGDWLLFLHADSRLNQRWVQKLIKIIRDFSSQKFAWYFNFKIKKENIQFRFLETAVAFRSYLFKKPYGDQGLLIHKNLYSSSGGYSPIKIMEDLDLIIRITKTNKLKSIGTDIYTDSIKWTSYNIINRAIKNASLRKRWRNGEDINELAKEYYS